MKKLTTMAQAEAELLSYAPNRSVMGETKLDNMRLLLDHLGSPQNELKVIHIAGTSGKTSTAYFTRALLEATGAKVGLTVSPHIETLRERLQVEGKPLSEKVFLDSYNIFREKVRGLSPKPTFFEIMIAFTFWTCRQNKVDYLVLETGLGGRLDATNTIDRADKVCVITNIGLDHTEILGHTLPEIALEKAGIIQPDNQVFVTDQPHEVLDIIRRKALQQKSSLQIVKPVMDLKALLPFFQQVNFSLAREVVRFVCERDGRKFPEDFKVEKVKVPGRWEKYQVEGKTIILDGAHNPQKLSGLAAEVERQNLKPISIISAFSQAPQEKIAACIGIVESLSDHVAYTTFIIHQDLTRRGCQLEELEKAAGHGLTFQPEPTKALAWALGQKSPVVVVTGSLYLVSQLRPIVREMAGE